MNKIGDIIYKMKESEILNGFLGNSLFLYLRDNSINNFINSSLI
jgi:hypothetical protein